ncbi:hypothetical protein [Coxiella-like endosymbiont]|uniref:hypothetical protein n=1 Tax=Coxiella-like endosymbiont TaxID=1592897 RepID=UPI00272CAC64|nr:hypothetical protein [Coxiella-like endosymbiont]
MNNKRYRTLKAKLDDVHMAIHRMAMHRIRKGENQEIILNDLQAQLTDTAWCCPSTKMV